MKNLIIITFTALSFTLASCVPHNIAPVTDTGDTPDPNTYMPVHKGCTWTYYFYMRGKTDVVNNPTVGTKTVTMTGDTINQGGIRYYKASAVTSSYTNTISFAHVGPLYFINDDDTNTLLASAINAFPCLNESQTAHSPTNLIVNPAPGSTDPSLKYIIGDITTKNISTLLNGLAYDNVISVTNNSVVNTSGPTQDWDMIEYKFAKGVGLISMVVYHHNTRLLEITLIKYTIK
ncbi:MAG: hypothetical protein V4592_01360 [Bacteroidota bacterium]